jgi:hypothetical protein
MRRLRSGMAWAFLLIAVVYLWLAVMVVRVPVLATRHYHTSPLVHRSPILGVLVALAILFGIAGWTVLKKKSSARGWALAASAVTLLPCLALFLGRHTTHPYSAWFCCALGVVGVAAFARPWTDDASTAGKRTSFTIPGDGTNRIANKLVWLAGIVAALVVDRPWYAWADAHGLPPADHWLSWPQLGLLILVIVVIHESGHALTGMALDMKLSAVILGPFQTWVSYGKWKFKMRWAGLMSFMGAVALIPATMDDYRRRKIWMVAGGPLANLVTGSIAVVVLLTAPGHSWAGAWVPLMYFSMDSLLIGLLNLIPFASGPRYSDGAKLYQLLTPGVWREYHWVMGMIHATTVSPMRPRDYDIAMIERVMGKAAQSNDELLLHLSAYAYYLDRDELDEGGRAIERADQFCARAEINPPAEWCGELAFGHAFLRRDAEAARRWWERLEAYPLKYANEGRWIALSALLWSEGRAEEAVEAWKKAAEWTQGLPQAGLWESERHALELLRTALDEPVAAAPSKEMELLAGFAEAGSLQGAAARI